MAINPFNFPGVTLTQEFVSPQTGSQAVLSAAVIGRPYYLHRADVTSEAATTEVTYNATAGNAGISLPERTEMRDGSFATVDPATTAWKYQKLLVKNGVFSHVELTTGLTHDGTASTTTKPVIGCGVIVRAGYGYTANALFGTREAQVGDTVKITVGEADPLPGVIRNITRSSSSTGLDTITVELSSGTIATSAVIAKVEFLVAADAEWEGTSTGDYFEVDAANAQFTIKQSLAARLDGTHNSPLLNGTYTFAIQYREYNDSFIGRLGSIADSDFVETVLGPAVLANPLALAVKLASLAAPGRIIYFTGVSAETSDGFQDALDFLNKYENCYSIVPLTGDPAIIADLLEDVIAVSNDEDSKIRRTLWYGLDPDIADSANWAAATDNYARVDVIKSIKNTIQASYRAQAIFADGAIYNGEYIPNYILAAAPAGMRSYEPCHRPLSNLGYSFISLEEPKGFTRKQLKAIGAEGIWIIGNNSDGEAINLRQVTTAAANDINQDEESIIANIDEIAISLCHVGETRVGCSNISPTMIMALSDDITIQMDARLINTTGSAYIGAQLISWTLDAIWQDEIERDHVYALISCTPPKPFNEFKMTLRVI